MGAVGGAPDHADQRTPAHAHRAKSARLPGQGDGAVLLRRGFGEAQGFRAEVDSDDVKLGTYRGIAAALGSTSLNTHKVAPAAGSMISGVRLRLPASKAPPPPATTTTYCTPSTA